MTLKVSKMNKEEIKANDLINRIKTLEYGVIEEFIPNPDWLIKACAEEICDQVISSLSDFSEGKSEKISFWKGVKKEVAKKYD